MLRGRYDRLSGVYLHDPGRGLSKHPDQAVEWIGLPLSVNKSIQSTLTRPVTHPQPTRRNLAAPSSSHCTHPLFHNPTTLSTASGRPRPYSAVTLGDPYRHVVPGPPLVARIRILVIITPARSFCHVLPPITRTLGSLGCVWRIRL